jgi:hypothetical protein
VKDAIRDLLIAHEGQDVRRVHPGFDVWNLARPGLLASPRRDRLSRFEACRAALIRALLSTEPARFIQHPDPPGDYDVPGDWQPHSPHIWRVPDAFDPRDRTLAAWLALGSWVAYAAPRAIEDAWPDVFRQAPDVVLPWIRTHRVQAAICSFYDDDEWRVLLGGDSPFVPKK